jgi:hypothetical protein
MKSRIKESNTKKVLISVFFAVIMIASSLAIIFSGYAPQGQNADYEGFTFKQSGNYLVTTVNKTTVKIQSQPYDLTRIALNDSVRELLRSTNMVYLSVPLKGLYADSASLAAFDLGEFLTNRGTYNVLAISDDNTGYEKIPIIDCRNATATVPVVLFMDGNETGIQQDGNCIKLISATSFDFVRLKDRLVLKLAGIMN